MTSKLNPYLSFRDNARQAMEFYRSVFGGELTVQTFGENGVPDEAEKDKVMHAQLEAPNGFVLMASDTPGNMEYRPGNNVSLSLSGGASDEGDLHGFWDKLSDGATVTIPLEKAPWGDTFGMLTDRFGTRWMVNVGAQ